MLLHNRRTLRHVALGLTLAASLTGCRCPQVKMPKWPWMPYTPSAPAPTTPSPVMSSPADISEPIPESSLPPLDNAPGPELAPAPLAPPVEEPEEKVKGQPPAPKAAPLPLPPPKSRTTQKPKAKSLEVSEESIRKPEEPRPLQTGTAARWFNGLSRKNPKTDPSLEAVTESDDSAATDAEPEVSSKTVAPQNRTVQLPKKDDPWRSQSDVKLPEIPPHRLKKSEQAQPAPKNTSSSDGLPTLSSPEPIRKRVTTQETELPKGHTPSAQLELELSPADGPSLIPSPSPYQTK